MNHSERPWTQYDLSFHDRDRWPAVVNAVKTFGFHKMRRNIGLAVKRLASHEITLLNGVSKYHTERKGKPEAVVLLLTNARTHAHIHIECVGLNKNIFFIILLDAELN